MNSKHFTHSLELLGRANACLSVVLSPEALMPCKPRTRGSPSSAQQSLLLFLASRTEVQVAPFTVPCKVLGVGFVVLGQLQCRTYDHGSLSTYQLLMCHGILFF